jgi:hypothetical protein
LDVKHFADPFMRWDDNRIVVLFNNFYNFNIIIDAIEIKNETHTDNGKQCDEIIHEAKIYLKINKPKFKKYTYDTIL